VERKPLSKQCALSTTHWRHTFSSLAVSTTSHLTQEWETARDVDALKAGKTPCELGFRGNLDEWERLMGAAASGSAARLTRQRQRFAIRWISSVHCVN
jgi:hypothetical protein